MWQGLSDADREKLTQTNLKRSQAVVAIGRGLVGLGKALIETNQDDNALLALAAELRLKLDQIDNLLVKPAVKL